MNTAQPCSLRLRLRRAWAVLGLGLSFSLLSRWVLGPLGLHQPHTVTICVALVGPIALVWLTLEGLLLLLTGRSSFSTLFPSSIARTTNTVT